MTREHLLYMASALFGTGLYALWSGPRSAGDLIGVSILFAVIAMLMRP